MNLTPSPSYFRIEPMNEDHDQHAFAPNHQVPSPASTLSSASYSIFFNSTQDHAGYYRTQSFQPQCQDQDENHGDGLSYEIKNKVSNGLKLTLWKKEDQTDDVVPAKRNINPVMMRKIKKNDGVATKAEKLQPSSSLETDISSNSCSYNGSSSPIRVCADCSTTKTPLWRSGPKGPKSLCNACGIRQRKARRAMAAAAAAGSDQPPAVRIKVQQKEKMRKNNKHSSNDLKKRCKMGAGSSNNGQKKLSFEDFLINLNKNLSFQRVFPEDEKDAAILLMALSSGLVHG